MSKRLLITIVLLSGVFVAISAQPFFNHDVGVSDITLTPDPVTSPGPYTIEATVSNWGHNPEGFAVFVEIWDVCTKEGVSDTLVWTHGMDVQLNAFDCDSCYAPSKDVVFPQWTPKADRCCYLIIAYTDLVGDQFPRDDAHVYVFSCYHQEPGAEEERNRDPETGFMFEVTSEYPSTTVSYEVPIAVQVGLKVYDISGNLVTTLVDGTRTPGHRTVTWNGTDDAGHEVATGIYMIHMDAGSFSDTKKVVLY